MGYNGLKDQVYDMKDGSLTCCLVDVSSAVRTLYIPVSPRHLKDPVQHRRCMPISTQCCLLCQYRSKPFRWIQWSWSIPWAVSYLHCTCYCSGPCCSHVYSSVRSRMLGWLQWPLQNKGYIKWSFQWSLEWKPSKNHTPLTRSPNWSTHDLL